MIAVGQRMHIVARAGADIAQHGAEARFFTRKVFRGGQLHVRNIALKRRHRQSRPFCNRGIIGEIIAAFTRGTTMSFQNNIKSKCLRCLRDPQARAIRRRGDRTRSIDHLDGIGDRDDGIAAPVINAESIAREITLSVTKARAAS
jgi:hypothetical protein